MKRPFEELNRFKIDKKSNPRSRYSALDRIRYIDNSVIIETQDEITVPTTLSDKFHAVTARDEDRLDLISYEYYQTAQFWWVIAYANSIYNPFNVPFGTVLRIPPLDMCLKIAEGDR